MVFTDRSVNHMSRLFQQAMRDISATLRQVYNAEDGKTYSGNLTFTGGNTLKLQGCALGGLICKGQTWTKAN